jgi:hypothetical protein
LVVVEGVETHEHLLAALAAGAQYGQGWLFEGAVPERWTLPDAMIGSALTAIVGSHLQARQPASLSGIKGEDRRNVLSRADKIGDRVRAFVARTRAGAGGAR